MNPLHPSQLTWTELPAPTPWRGTWDDDTDKYVPGINDLELVRPGVAFQMTNGNIILVGHINPADGMCGCCGWTPNNDALVARYATVLDLPDTDPRSL